MCIRDSLIASKVHISPLGTSWRAVTIPSTPICLSMGSVILSFLPNHLHVFSIRIMCFSLYDKVFINLLWAFFYWCIIIAERAGTISSAPETCPRPFMFILPSLQITAVSYTHLDVYKRQLHMLVRSLFAVSKSIAAKLSILFSLHRQRYDKKAIYKILFSGTISYLWNLSSKIDQYLWQSALVKAERLNHLCTVFVF